MSEAPATVNGYPVVVAQPSPRGLITRPGFVILVDRGPENHTDHDRWVTAWIGEGDTYWAWGHYFGSEVDARHDYADRCKRGY